MYQYYYSSSMKQLRTYILSVLTLTIVGSIAGYAQTRVFSAQQFLRPSTNKQSVQLASTVNAKAIQYDAESARQMLMNNSASVIKVTDFPISTTETQTVDFMPMNPVMDGATHVYKSTPNGEVEIPIPAMIAYKGRIKGEDNSRVIMVYAGNEMYCSVQRQNGVMSQITPEVNSKTGNHLLSAVTNTGFDFTCYADRIDDYHHTMNANAALYGKGSNKLMGTNLLEIEVALDIDHLFYAKFGNNQDKLMKYVFSIFAMVSMKYEDEVNVTFKIGTVIIRPDAANDPYTQNIKGDISALLGEFQSQWRSKHTSVNRDIAHMLTAPGSTSVGGIAFLDVLCNKNRGYGVSGVQGVYKLPSVGYTWDAMVVTHEIGHNFSAPHTHACVWNPPIDSCVTTATIGDACTSGEPKLNPGSIMSYCHLIQPASRYTFLPQVAAVIRTGAERATSCISAPASAVVRVVYPIGGQDQVFRSDTTITVKWNSAKVNTVNVEYSLDSGATWVTIANGLAATQKSVQWALPDVSSKVARVRVYDVSNQLIGDTTYTSFSIGTASIQVTYPAGGERMGQGISQNLTWNTTLVKSVNVQFSATGAAPWTTLVSSSTGNALTWTVPMVSTNTAKIRVVDASNSELLSESNEFAIGVATLELLSPLGGNTYCVGDTVNVDWKSDFIDNVKIDFSTNNGQTFSISGRIASSTPARTQTLRWIVPNRPTTEGKVRISNLANTDMLDISDAAFIVKVCETTDVSENTLPEFSAALFPNPATNKVCMRVSGANSTRFADCYLVNLRGEKIMLGTALIQNGNSLLEFDVRVVPQGTYIFAVESQGKVLHLPFSISR